MSNLAESQLSLDGVARIYAIIAIGIHKELQNEIHTIYLKNEEESVEAYLSSPYYNHPVFSSYNAIQEKRIIEVASLYSLYEKEGKGDDFILSFLTKGYKRIKNYAEQRVSINLSEFAEQMIEREKELPEYKIIIYVGILLFLGKEKIDMSRKFNEIQTYNLLYSFKQQKDVKASYHDARKAIETEALSKFTALTKVKVKKEEILDKLSGRIEEVLIKELPKQRNENEFFDKLYQKPILRYQKPLTSIMRLHNLNDYYFFGETIVTRNDILDIYQIFKYSEESNRLSDDDFEVFIVASLIILGLTKQYQELRHAYVNEGNEAIEIAIKKKKEFTEALSKLTSEKEAYQQRFTHLEELMKKQQDYIDELERNQREEKLKLQEYEELKREVVALREFVFQEKKAEEELEEKNQQHSIENIKIAVVGGHERWHRKLKDFQPNIQTIHPDNINIDFSFFGNMDIVIFETTYSNHTIYNKAIQTLKGRDVPIAYINGQQSISAFIGVILRKLRN